MVHREIKESKIINQDKEDTFIVPMLKKYI